MIKLGVLISGSGTNMMAIQSAIEAGELDASIELVISSRPDAVGLKKAEEAGLKTMTLSAAMYENPIVADAIIANTLEHAEVDYVVMAGYMRRVYYPVLETFEDRVLNIHPALLPSFPGAHAIRDAFDAGVKVTGVTVHFANAQYDEGPIIAQRAVAIEEGTSMDKLETAIHKVEHKLYPEVLQMLAEGRVSLDEKRHVKIRPVEHSV